MPRPISEIDADIERTKEELESAEGTPAEVYTRIVGYYRSVRNWNKGKREEYRERKLFVPSGEGTAARLREEACACGNATAPGAFSAAEAAREAPARYELFARKSCPNCPPVREYVEARFGGGKAIDVDSEEGFAAAQERGVLSTPTVIFYSEGGAEIARAHSVSEIKAAEAAILPKAALPA